MAKSNITATVFVDWDRQIILTTDELDEYRDNRKDELANEVDFDTWLDENYSASEVWDNADNINDNWDEYLEGCVADEMADIDEVEIDFMPHEYKVNCPF